MRTIPTIGALRLEPETPAEQAELDAWHRAHAGHVFRLDRSRRALVLVDLGPGPEACREPINITWDNTPAPFNLVSNLAPSPFILDGRPYASVEGFWQGLKFPDEDRRRTIAALDRHAARRAGESAPKAEAFLYDGRRVLFGTHAHWALMEAACRAKFAADAPSREALLSTGTRPLVHRVAKDSLTIPGAIMAQIWMRIRKRLQEGRLMSEA